MSRLSDFILLHIKFFLTLKKLFFNNFFLKSNAEFALNINYSTKDTHIPQYIEKKKKLFFLLKTFFFKINIVVHFLYHWMYKGSKNEYISNEKVKIGINMF